MATVPGFIYLTQRRKLGTTTNSFDNDLISNLSFEEDRNTAAKSNWGIQPGVLRRIENKWVPYDNKVANRIMKAEEIGVPKIRFNKPSSAYSQCISVQGRSSSRFSVIHEFLGSKRPISSDSDSIGAPDYEVDLINMKEVHLESGIMKDIKIVKASMTGCLFRTFSTSNDSTAEFSIEIKKCSSRIVCQNTEGQKYTVSWKHDIHGWCLYSDSCQRAIWSAWTKGDNLLSTKIVRSAKNRAKNTHSTECIIDLKRMQQINTTNGQRKPIEIAMWISSSLFPHMWIRDNCKYLTQEIGGDSSAEGEIMLYKLALSRLLSSEYVKSAISEHMEPHTLKSLELSNHLDLAENDHWYRFLHSFMQRVQEIPDNLGHLWRFALNPNGHHHPSNPFTSRGSNGLWRFVFGAPADGLDAHTLTKSGTQTLASSNDIRMNWFGLSSAITEFHCKPVSPGVVSMLVFLVMMPKNFHESPKKAVAMKKVKDYLPVASITVCIDDRTLGPACSLWEDKNEETDGSTLGPASSLWEDTVGQNSPKS